MPQKLDNDFDAATFETELEEHDQSLGELPGWIFKGLVLHIYQHRSDRINVPSSTGQEGLDPTLRMNQACNTARFAGANFTDDLTDKGITHVLVETHRAPRALREVISR